MSFHRRPPLAAVVLSGVLATPAVAQEARRVAPGDRVRVSAPTYVDGTRVAGSARWTVGRVREVTRTTIVVQTASTDPAAATTIPLDVVRYLEVSQGRISSGEGMRRGMGRGMLIGGGMALAYVAMLQILPSECDDDDEDCDIGPYVDDSAGASARNVGIGLAAGAAIRALLGSQASEVWVPAEWRGPRVAVKPGGGGVAVSVNLRLQPRGARGVRAKRRSPVRSSAVRVKGQMWPLPRLGDAESASLSAQGDSLETNA